MSEWHVQHKARGRSIQPFWWRLSCLISLINDTMWMKSAVLKGTTSYNVWREGWTSKEKKKRLWTTFQRLLHISDWNIQTKETMKKKIIAGQKDRTEFKLQLIVKCQQLLAFNTLIKRLLILIWPLLPFVSPSPSCQMPHTNSFSVIRRHYKPLWFAARWG